MLFILLYSANGIAAAAAVADTEKFDEILLPPQEFRVDMGSMFERCVDVFRYFDTWLSFSPSFSAFLFSLIHSLSLSPSHPLDLCLGVRNQVKWYLFLCMSLFFPNPDDDF